MRLPKKLALAMAFVTGLSGSVEAAELYTPLLLVATGNFMSCLVSNVGKRATTARIEVFSFSGALLYDSGQFPLAAGETNGASGFEDARCKFTVGSKNVRAHAAVHDATLGSVGSAAAR